MYRLEKKSWTMKKNTSVPPTSPEKGASKASKGKKPNAIINRPFLNTVPLMNANVIVNQPSLNTVPLIVELERLEFYSG